MMGMLGALRLLSPRTLLYAGGIAVCGWIAWQAYDFVTDKYEAEARAERLERNVAEREAQIETLQLRAAQAEAARAAADAARLDAEKRALTYRALRNEALEGGEDGPVAPVLRGTLDALSDGMR